MRICNPAYLIMMAAAALCAGGATVFAGGKQAGGAVLPAGGGAARGGYVTVSVKDDADGNTVLDAFTRAGLRGVIAEANQTVYLQNFSSLQEMTPAEFLARVTESDPRNDGFAERVHRFFVSGGENRFYIPAAEFGLMAGKPAIEERVREALRETGADVLRVAAASRAAASSRVTASSSRAAAASPRVTPASSGTAASSAAAAASGTAAASPRLTRPAAGVNIFPGLPFIAAWILTVLLYVRHAKRQALRLKIIARIFPLLVLLPCGGLGTAGCFIAAAILALRPYLAAKSVDSIILLVERRTVKTKKPGKIAVTEAAVYGGLAAAAAILVSKAAAIFVSKAAVVVLMFAGLFALADAAALFLSMARFAYINAKYTVSLRFTPVPLRAPAGVLRRIPPSAALFLLAGAVSGFFTRLSPAMPPAAPAAAQTAPAQAAAPAAETAAPAVPAAAQTAAVPAAQTAPAQAAETVAQAAQTAAVPMAAVPAASQDAAAFGLAYTDYQAHYQFQRDFMFARLPGRPESGAPGNAAARTANSAAADNTAYTAVSPVYTHYAYDSDGLLFAAAPASADNRAAAPASTVQAAGNTAHAAGNAAQAAGNAAHAAGNAAQAAGKTAARAANGTPPAPYTLPLLLKASGGKPPRP